MIVSEFEGEFAEEPFKWLSCMALLYQNISGFVSINPISYVCVFLQIYSIFPFYIKPRLIINKLQTLYSMNIF